MSQDMPTEPAPSPHAGWRDPANYRSLLALDPPGWAWTWLQRNPGYRARATNRRPRPSVEPTGTRLRIITASAAHDAADWGLHFRRGARLPGHRCPRVLAGGLASVGADG